MMVNTAVGFFLAGVCLLLSLKNDPANSTILVVRAFASILVIGGTATLSEYILHKDSGSMNFF